jgi:hypothetical protein
MRQTRRRKARKKGVNPPPSASCPRASRPPKGWIPFEVGDDITQSKELMQFLAERKRNPKKGRTYSLEEVKAELGIR